MTHARLVSRRTFLTAVAGTVAVSLLTACGGPAAPAAGGATAAPATGSGQRKTVVFWGRQQFLPGSNDYLTESVKLAGQKGGFDVSVQLFTNDEHPQKEVVAMESGVVPDITYTYAPALWDQNGYALEVQALYDEIGKSGGGWLELAEGSSKNAAGKRIAVPMNTEPWFLHLRKDKFEEVGATLPLKTWDQMMDAFQKVNKPSEGFYAFDGQMTEADWVGNCLQFMWAFGGRLFDKEGTPTINTPQNIAGVKAYTALFKNKMMPPGVVSQKASGNNEAWLAKQVAAVSNPGSIVLAMRDSNKELLNNTYLQAFPVKGKDTWNKMISENIVPWTIPDNADSGLTPILDDIGISATKEMLQAIVVQNKTPQEGLNILADAAEQAARRSHARDERGREDRMSNRAGAYPGQPALADPLPRRPARA